MKFEKNPLSGKSDATLDLRMAPLDVVIHRSIVDNVMKFFYMDESVDLSQLTREVFLFY